MFFGSGWESRLARFVTVPIRTATKRASGGKSANKSTAGRRLGPKKGEGQFVEPGQIIWRQRGTNWYPGENTGIGRDHTIFALEPGYVRYYRDPFHAERRFIGIALGHDDRLPTPHFDPRKRRFGYTPIDNQEIAEFELGFLTRKETHRLNARESILRERAAAKEKRISTYKETLKVAGLEAVSDFQLQRLDSIYQFLCGGSSLDEARELVRAHIVEDLDIERRAGRIDAEAQAAQLASITKEQEAVDAVVSFGANRQLASVDAVGAEAREKVLAKIKTLAEPHLDSTDGTPAAVVAEVEAILTAAPVFSAADVASIKKTYLRRPLPVLVTPDTKADLVKRAAAGAGELRKVWDSKVGAMKEYFVPTGAKLLFN